MPDLVHLGRTRPRAASAIGCALLLVSSCGGADFSSWKPYSPEGAAFTVSLPGTPVKEHQLGMNPRGNIETDIYSLDLAEGGFLTITDGVMPPGIDIESGAKEIIDSSVGRIVESASARVRYTRDITIAGYAAREIDAEVPTAAVPGGGRLRARVVLVGTRLYELIGIVPNRQTAEAELDHFLNSFTLREVRKTN